MVTFHQFQSDWMYKQFGNGQDRKIFDYYQSWMEQMSVNQSNAIAQEYAAFIKEEAAKIADEWDNSGELGKEIRNIKFR